MAAFSFGSQEGVDDKQSLHCSDSLSEETSKVDIDTLRQRFVGEIDLDECTQYCNAQLIGGLRSGCHR